MELIDTHCHLNDSKFSADLQDTISRAQKSGVCGMVVVGWDVGSSRLAVELAEKYEPLYAAVGIHPHDASDATTEALEAIRKLAEHPKVVAIGETGLDFYRNLSPPEDQRDAFRRFLDLAAQTGKALIIHSREADEEVLPILQDNRPEGVNIVRHCFSGDTDIMQAYLDLDCWLGIAGPVTYPNASKLREVVAAAPENRIVVETDCPWLPPQGHRGKRNEPALVSHVAERVAKVREITLQAAAEMTTANARTLYGIEE